MNGNFLAAFCVKDSYILILNSFVLRVCGCAFVYGLKTYLSHVTLSKVPSSQTIIDYNDDHLFTEVLHTDSASNKIQLT